MNITEYVIPLGENARRRHYHEAERGKILRFSVQLEILVESNWTPVIRYDCSHGFVHMDRYRIGGQKRKKRLSMELREALVFADRDINENWEVYERVFREDN